VDGNLNLSRAIGDLIHKKNSNLPLKEQAITSFPDVKCIKISNKMDFIVMGCDGIWESHSCQQVVDWVGMQMQRKVKITKICEGFLDVCLSPNVERTMGRGCDNMSIILIDMRVQ
jgi:protein phosphatase 1G